MKLRISAVSLALLVAACNGEPPATRVAAIAECRRRTLLYIALPANESFVLEYVNDKPWSAYD